MSVDITFSGLDDQYLLFLSVDWLLHGIVIQLIFRFDLFTNFYGYFRE